jgi:DHA2 family multidrug resistance protein-like MFS transporter
VLQALKNVGSPLGAAVLGSVLNTGYQSRLVLGGLPAPAAAAARQSVFAGLAVAARLHAPSLLAEVRGAFTAGLDQVLWISAAVALLGAILALAFLPGGKGAVRGRRSNRLS